MNFARLNHILIPATKDGRDRFRNTPTGRLLQPVFRLYLALTPEGRFLAIFWMLTGAAGLEVGATQIYVLFALVTGLLAASFLGRRFYRMDHASVVIEAPTRAVVGEPLPIAIRVRNPSDRPLHDLGVTPPLLPWDGRWVTPPGELVHVAAGAEARLRLAARFMARGDHHLDPFHVGRVLPLGVTSGPVRDTHGIRFLVRARPAVVGDLPLALGAHSRHAGGGRLTPDARDLAGTRPYRPGDRVRDLHARSWARVGAPVVREWREERLADAAVVLALAPDARPDATDAAVSLAAGLICRLHALGAALEAVVVSGQAPLVGPRLETPDAALDAIARAEAAPLLPGALERSLDGVGNVFWITDAWGAPLGDAEPEALPAALRARGVPVQVLATLPPPRRRERRVRPVPSTPWIRGVPTAAVLSGQRIDLGGAGRGGAA